MLLLSAESVKRSLLVGALLEKLMHEYEQKARCPRLFSVRGIGEMAADDHWPCRTQSFSCQPFVPVEDSKTSSKRYDRHVFEQGRYTICIFASAERPKLSKVRPAKSIKVLTYIDSLNLQTTAVGYRNCHALSCTNLLLVRSSKEKWVISTERKPWICEPSARRGWLDEQGKLLERSSCRLEAT